MTLNKKSVQEQSSKIFQKTWILIYSFLLSNLKNVWTKLMGGRTGMLTGHRCGVSSEMPFELVDITQDPWEESRHPCARAVTGQAGSLRVSHMAPDVCGWLNLDPRTYSFTGFIEKHSFIMSESVAGSVIQNYDTA